MAENNKPKIVLVPDKDGNPAYAASHSDAIKMKGENKILTDVLVKEEEGAKEESTTINYKMSGMIVQTDYAIGADGKAWSTSGVLSGKAVSKFIAIAPGTEYTCKSTAFGIDSRVGMAFYTDEDEESYVPNSFTRANGTVSGTVPDTAKYVRITWPTGTTNQTSTNCLIYHEPSIVYIDKIEALEKSLEAKANSSDVTEAISNAVQEAKEEEEAYVTEIDLSDRCYLTRANTIAAVGSVSGILSDTALPTSNWTGAAIPCEAGDKFIISAISRTTGQRIIGFVDENNVTLSAYTRNSAIVDETFTAPDGVKRLLVNGSRDVVKIKKIFAEKTKLSETGVDFVEYNTPILYGANGNTRNGTIGRGATSFTSTEGDENKLKTDNIWLPKNSRVTFHVEGENVSFVGIDYSIKGSTNLYTFTNKGTFTFLTYSDGVLAFMFNKSDNSALTPSELTSWVQIERPAEESVADFNADKDALIFAATRHPANSHSVEISGTTPFPCFCVVTDVHDSWKQLWRVLDYADSNPYILGTLFLGDITASTGYSNGDQYSQPVIDMIMQHNKPLLRISGNHDGGITRAMYMESWFPDRVVAKTGETHKEGCPWWYIDFPYTFKARNSDSSTVTTTVRTLRIIGNFDNDSGATAASGYFGTSDEQYQWICDRLAECDANTHVMILRHFSTIGVTEDNLIGDWRPKSHLWSPSGDNTGNQGKLCDIVNAWMKGEVYTNGTVSKDFSEGGVDHSKRFVCYLTGHWHKDYVLKHPTYPQVDIAQTCTAIENHGSNKYSKYDIPSSDYGKEQDSFNVVAIGLLWRSINIVRIGSDVTTDLRDRKMVNINSDYGFKDALHKGTTAQRPTAYLQTYDNGFEYFDITLGKKILWNGDTWTNFDGSLLNPTI